MRNDEVWITLEDTGRVQVYSATPPFDQRALLETGPITNHVNFANNRNGKFGYVTIGGLNLVKGLREIPAEIPEPGEPLPELFVRGSQVICCGLPEAIRCSR